MNFKDAFDKDCSKINVSDELINRTLMAAMTDDDNSHTMDNPHTIDNSHTMDNRTPYVTGKAGLKRMGKKVFAQRLKLYNNRCCYCRCCYIMHYIL